MKIIISPSKLQEATLDKRLQDGKLINTQKTKHLNEYLQKIQYHDLQNLYAIKGKLLDETYAILHEKEKDRGHAVATYKGIVFKEINLESYDLHQLAYMKEHLVILSALYGVLEAHSLIEAYRLDMTIRLDGIQLYDYWKDEISQYFKEETLIVNLASIEFSKMLAPFKKKMLNIHFKEEQSDGRLKVVTVRAKQARGLMVDYLISNCIEDTEQIKNFSEAGYHFSSDLSTEKDWYFIKNYDL